MGHTISKNFDFDAAHRLIGHSGKCRNLHGHRYTASVCIAPCKTEDEEDSGKYDRDELTDDMVIDFGIIGPRIKSWIDTNWDHNVLLHSDDAMIEWYVHLSENEDLKLPFYFSTNPTAERMAEVLYHQIKEHLLSPGISVESIGIWETATSMAYYSEA